MSTATRLVLATCAFMLWAGAALAQDRNVTFQVDMNPYVTTCQHVPGTDDVQIRGDIFGWDDSAPTLDDDGDGTYSITIPIAEGTSLIYKYFSTGGLDYEDQTGDRPYTVTSEANQVIPEVVFADGEPVDQCSGTKEDYEILFSVDMTVAIQRGAFDEATQELYVAGAISDWGSAAGNPDYQLLESSTEDNIYTGLIQATAVPTPGMSPYKFITYVTSDATIGWESGGDRFIEITGEEGDADMNGFQEVIVPRRFFDDVSFDDVLSAAATVTFEVDMNPADYQLTDNGVLPVNTGAGEDETMISGVWLNGPAMWESVAAGGPGGGIRDWLGWNGELEANTDFQAEDPDADMIYTLTLEYPAGALRRLVGKWGVNGSDNEANVGNDHFYQITEGAQTVSKVFGAMQPGSGLWNDDNGPNGAATFDPYILIDNDATPPTAMAVRNGGEADGMATSIEPGGELPDGLTLAQNYPNPFNPATSISFEVLESQDIALRVYDLTGREVATLVNEFTTAGTYTVRFDASGLASGSYLYQLEANGQVITRMMSLLK